VDTSEDEKLGIPEVRFNKENAIIAGLMKEMFDKRKQYKEEGKDALQFTTKIVLNTTYGLLGSSLSPLYYKPLAAAVTAYGR